VDLQGRLLREIAKYFLANHPAVLRLIRIVVEEAGKIPVTVCGELAADLESIPLLLRLGRPRLSVAPPFVPAVKSAIRKASTA
jgi:phosphotransferase system enzyme I (PtsI)